MIGALLTIFLVSVNVNSRVATSSSNTVSIKNRVQVRVNQEGQATEELRLEFKERVQEAKEQREQAREEFRARLGEIKDETKRKLTEKLGEQINSVNEKWVEKWNKTLERLEKILDKIEVRAEKDGVEIEGAIGDAREAINQAQGKINEQAGRVYEVKFDEESKLGQAVSATIAKLKADLRLTRESVDGAKEAVHGALKALTSSKGGGSENE